MVHACTEDITPNCRQLFILNREFFLFTMCMELMGTHSVQQQEGRGRAEGRLSLQCIYLYLLILCKEFRPLYYLCFSKSDAWILLFVSHHYLRSISILTISLFEYLLLNRYGLPKTVFPLFRVTLLSCLINLGFIYLLCKIADLSQLVSKDPPRTNTP